MSPNSKQTIRTTNLFQDNLYVIRGRTGKVSLSVWPNFVFFVVRSGKKYFLFSLKEICKYLSHDQTQLK